MPHFVFRNVPEKQVKDWSTTLLSNIAKELDMPAERITFSYVEGHTYSQGKDISGDMAFVDIHWAARSGEVKAVVSNILVKELEAAGWKSPVILYHDFGPETCWFKGDFIGKPPAKK